MTAFPCDEKREFMNGLGSKVTLLSVKTITVNKTRPNNTNTYTAGDVFNSSTSAGTVFTFENCAYRVGGEGVITKAKIIESCNQSSLYPRFELFLFSVAPAAANIAYDADPFAPTDAELLNLVGIIPFSTSYEAKAGSGDTGSSVHVSDNVHIPFNCATASADLYGGLVIRNAYVPIASSTVSVSLSIL